MSVDVNFRSSPNVSTSGTSSGGSAAMPTTWAFANPAVTKTADYTLTNADGSIKFDASGRQLTATLPPAASCYLTGSGQVLLVKKVDTSNNAVVIQGATPSETIDGFTSMSITLQYDSVIVQSNGKSWDVLSAT